MDPLRKNLITFRPPTVSMPSDNTRVAPRPVKPKSAPSSPESPAWMRKLHGDKPLPQPAQHFIGPAPRLSEKERRSREVQYKLQESRNKAYQLDPFAQQAIGMTNFGTMSKPNVQKTGLNPFEGLALAHPGARMVLGTAETIKEVAHTIEDPSLKNIGLSLLAVGGTVSGVAGKVKGPLSHSKVVHTLAHSKPMHAMHLYHEGATLYHATAPKGSLPSLPQPGSSGAAPRIELDVGPTVRNLELKKQMGDEAWNKLWNSGSPKN